MYTRWYLVFQAFLVNTVVTLRIVHALKQLINTEEIYGTYVQITIDMIFLKLDIECSVFFKRYLTLRNINDDTFSTRSTL